MNPINKLNIRFICRFEAARGVQFVLSWNPFIYLIFDYVFESVCAQTDPSMGMKFHLIFGNSIYFSFPEGRKRALEIHFIFVLRFGSR